MQILCCDIPDYHYENCLDYTGDWGEHISCPERTADDGMVVTAYCGSGGDKDCKDNSHIVRVTRYETN